jgi:hypothetical protein
VVLVFATENEASRFRSTSTMRLVDARVVGILRSGDVYILTVMNTKDADANASASPNGWRCCRAHLGSRHLRPQNCMIERH